MRTSLLVLMLLAVIGTLAVRRNSDDDYEPPSDWDQGGDPSDYTGELPQQSSGDSDPTTSEQQVPSEEQVPKPSFMMNMAPMLVLMVVSKAIPSLDCGGSMIPMLISVFFYQRIVVSLAQTLQINLRELDSTSLVLMNSATAVMVFASVVNVGKTLGYFQPAGQAKLGEKAAPISSLQFVQGEHVDVTKQGCVKVVEFWASWCGPCKSAIPHLNEFWKTLTKQYGADKVQFVGINLGEDEDKVNSFIKEMDGKMQYPVALDPDRKTSTDYPTAGIPHAYVVDQQGVFCWAGHPGNKEMMEAIHSALKAEQAPSKGAQKVD